VTTTSFPLSGPIQLSCRLGMGTITVHADDGVTEAKVVLTARDAKSDYVERTTVELSGSTLVVHGPKPRGPLFDLPVFAGRFGERDAVDADITVPAGTPVKIASWGADVVVKGQAGTTDIMSGSTTTEIDDVDGDLRLRYGSGPARARRITGSVVVRAGSGSITFGEVAGSIEVGCGSGSLEVGNAGGRVRMRTGTGQATIGAAGGDVDFTSGSGGLSVGLRRGQPARLDVITGAGQLRSDVAVEDGPPADTARAITIKARTGSGDVRIFRADPMPDAA
jgi:hypothetical protein